MWSFNKAFANGRMDIFSFVEKCNDLNLQGVEFNRGYFGSSFTDTRVLNVLKRLAASLSLDIVAISIENNFCRNTWEDIKKEKNIILEGLDVAYHLGAPILRVNTGPYMRSIRQYVSNKKITKMKITSWVIQTFKELVKIAERKGIIFALENHFGITKTSNDVIRIIKEVNSEYLRVNIDTGNFFYDVIHPKKWFEDPYKGIERLLPYAIFTHAKIWELTDDGTNENHLDYDKILDLYNKYNYKGYISLEYMGSEDPLKAIPKAIKMLRHKLKNSVQ